MQPEEVGGAPGSILDPESGFSRALDQLGREIPAVLGDAGGRPLEHELERGIHHRHQDEVAALADVVAGRTGLVAVGVVARQAGEVAAAFAADPRLFQGDAVQKARAEVGQADGIGPHQPLVAGADECVGPDAGHVELHCAHRLRAVDDEVRSDFPGARGNGVDVEEGSVGPVDGAHGDDRGIGIDGLEDAGAPALAAAGAGARIRHPQLGPALAGEPSPTVHVAGKLARGEHDVGATRHVDVAGAGRYSIGSRRDDGDVVGGSVDEAAETAAEFVAGVEEVGGPDPAGCALGADALDTGFLHNARERAQVCAVDVVDVRIEGEGGLLAGEWDHGACACVTGCSGGCRPADIAGPGWGPPIVRHAGRSAYARPGMPPGP